MNTASMDKGLPQALLFTLCLVSAPPLLAGQLVTEIGYEYEDAAADTEITTVPLQLTYYTDVWSYAIELSWLSVSGDATVIPDSRGGIVNAQGQTVNAPGNTPGNTTAITNSVTRSGMGDTRLSLARAFFPERDDGVFYEVTATVKLPTANEDKFLGTGETDYSVKLAMSIERDRWSPGLELGYQWTGDRPDTDFNDVVFASVGTGYRIDRHSSMGFGFDFRQATVDGADDYASIGVNYSTDILQRSRLGFGVDTGLTDNSPDAAFGVSLSTEF